MSGVVDHPIDPGLELRSQAPSESVCLSLGGRIDVDDLSPALSLALPVVVERLRPFRPIEVHVEAAHRDTMRIWVPDVSSIDAVAQVLDAALSDRFACTPLPNHRLCVRVVRDATPQQLAHTSTEPVRTQQHLSVHGRRDAS